MPQRISDRDSSALYFVKAIAILAAVAAHISVVDLSTPAIAHITRAWDMFSTISVPCFFVVGGVLYTRKEGDSAAFWRKKWKFMVLPWLFCSVLTCTLRGLMGYPSDLLGYVKWILGVGTWYYYVTMYLVMLVIFKPIYRCPAALWTCVAVTAVSLVLRSRSVQIPVDTLVQSEYLNPMYWVGYFSLGILLRRRGLELSKWLVAACFVILPVSTVWVYRNWIYTYFDIANTVLSLSAFVVLLTLGRWLASTKLAAPIQWIGTSTYCIYLLHMQIVQSAARRLPDGTFKQLIAPFFGVAVMMVLIEIGKFITRKLPFGDKLRMLVGLR